MRRTAIMVAASASGLALLVSGCGSSAGGGSASGGTTGRGGQQRTLQSIDWANITDSGALQISIQNSIKAAGQKLGVNVKTYNNNADAVTALRNAQLMLADKPDAVADFNVDINTNKQLGTLFNRASMPCVGVDIQVPQCVWMQLNNPKMGAEAGATVAKIARSRGWTGKDTTVIGITTWSTGPFVNGCVTGFYSSFAKGLPGMQQKAAADFSPNTTRIGSNYIGLDAGLIPGPAFAAVQKVLPSIPKGQHLVIVGLNDDVVNAGLKAANDAGFKASTMAVGLGDGSSIDELRSNPQWVAEDDIFYPGWGEVLLGVADGLINGVKPHGPVEIPATVVTKNTVNTYYGKAGHTATSLPLPAADRYLVKLGVLQKFGNFRGL